LAIARTKTDCTSAGAICLRSRGLSSNRYKSKANFSRRLCCVSANNRSRKSVSLEVGSRL